MSNQTPGEVWYALSKDISHSDLFPCIILETTEKLVHIEVIKELNYIGNEFFQQNLYPTSYRHKIPKTRIEFVEKPKNQIVYCIDTRLFSSFRKHNKIIYRPWLNMNE